MTASEGNGGVYDGDMRENISKALISVGINNANFGMSIPRVISIPTTALSQIVVHTSIGKYANGYSNMG